MADIIAWHGRSLTNHSAERDAVVKHGYKVIFLLALSGLLAGCMYSPLNGEVSSDDPVGKSFQFTGLINQPNVPVQVQVLADPDGDPNNWVTVANARTGTTPALQQWPGWYFWSTYGTPVPSSAARSRWPLGGLMWLRALSPAVTSLPGLVVFDEDFYDCMSQHPDDSNNPAALGNDCQTTNSREVAIIASSRLLPSDFGGIPYLSKKGWVDPLETSLYYQTIHAPTTLADFKRSFGFGAAGSDEASAIYYNDGDLGIGREMHCRSFDLIVPSSERGRACYVSNYGVVNGVPNFGGDPQAALNDAVAHRNAFATVAMVYTPPITAPNSVKFMVYGSTGNLQNTAQLDQHGFNTSVPNNCMVCHAGSGQYDDSSHSVTGAYFLPFDVFSFKYSENPSFTFPAQADQLRRLNDHVNHASPTAGIAQLIAGMYAPKLVSDPTATANNTYVPPGWSTGRVPTKLYTSVVKPFCRTCHLSQTSGMDWTTYDGFTAFKNQIVDDVCEGHSMPQAEHTQDNMWRSSARAHLLGTLDMTRACGP